VEMVENDLCGSGGDIRRNLVVAVEADAAVTAVAALIGNGSSSGDRGNRKSGRRRCSGSGSDSGYGSALQISIFVER
jgi:hypothetical protein